MTVVTTDGHRVVRFAYARRVADIASSQPAPEALTANTAANPADRPIGVFDSGVGGLTVLRELRRQLPNESTIYLGDEARMPYGPREPAEVVSFTREAMQLEGAARQKALHKLQLLESSLLTPVPNPRPM